MPKEDVKNYQAKKRTVLYNLINQAYEWAKTDEELDIAQIEALKTLGFKENSVSQKQSAKYSRYQFILPQLPNIEYWDSNNSDLKNLFITVFGDEAQKNYKLLRVEHPDGVDCWVNENNKSNSKHPLIESHMQSTINSIDTASEQLIHEIAEQRKNLGPILNLDQDINNQFINRQQAQLTFNLEKMRLQTEKEVQRLFAQPIDTQALNNYRQLNWFYRLFIKEPTHPFEAQYKKAKLALQKYHRYSIAQLTQFEQVTARLPSNKEYKTMYQRFAKAEQSMKLAKEESQLSPAAQSFNQDIFAIQIGTDDERSIQYHDRHYALTTNQAEIQSLEANTRYATATAHTPEFLLANYANYEEGCVSDGKVELNFTGIRNGSYSPSELHKGTYHKSDKHEQSYHALCNMEQSLLAIRCKVIESCLEKLIIDPAKRSQVSLSIAQTISHAVHQSQINDNPGAIDKKTIINDAVDELKNIDESKDQLQEKLNQAEYQDQVINPKLFHTHLITAPGIGGQIEQQRKQFYSARYAQYATQTDLQGANYFSFGVNAMRWDSFLGDAKDHKVKRNNCVAMVELYRYLDSINQLDGVALNFNAYTTKLDEVRLVAKQYYSDVETKYADAKKNLLTHQQDLAIKMQKLEKLIHYIHPNVEQLKRLQHFLEDNSVSSSEKQAINEQMDKLKIKLQTLSRNKVSLINSIEDIKTEIQADKSILDDVISNTNIKRDTLRDKETELHELANILNRKIYNQIREKNDLTGHWAIYQLIQELFSGSNALGLDNWKFDANNGLLQTLLQWISDETDAYASTGCKSNNDRALFVSLLVTELSKKKVSEFNPSQDTAFNNEGNRIQFRDDATQAIATHISNHQTQKDRSNLPKTGENILLSAKKILSQFFSKLSHRISLAKFAAHKRKSDINNVSIDTLHCYSSQSFNQFETLLQQLWFTNELKEDYPDITKKLGHGFSLNKGLTDDQHIEKYVHIRKYLEDSYPDSPKLAPLKLWVDLHIKCLKAIKEDKKDELFESLKSQLMTIKETVDSKMTTPGKGQQALKRILINLDSLDESDDSSLFKLVELTMQCQQVASPRANDFTSKKSDYPTSLFFLKDRSQALKDLYENLAKPIELKQPEPLNLARDSSL